MNAKHSSFDSFGESSRTQKFEDEDEDLLSLWLILKDVEKLLTRSFCNMVNIQELNVQLSIRGRYVSLVSSQTEYRKGVCKMVYEGKEYFLPESKFRLLADLKNIPVPTESKKVPERKNTKKQLIFGELVDVDN